MAFAGVLCTIHAYAGNIKVLPSDPAVTTVETPNGIRCYVVSSPFLKGMADFALVQNTGSRSCQSLSSDDVVALSRECLTGQPRLIAESVQNHFISLGAVAEKDGFVNVTDDATVFHFRNINISARETALDSSLLVLMGIVEKLSSHQDTLIRNWYTPSDHAIIVAGDVNAPVVIEKLKMLSYMVPGAESLPRHGYVWQESDTKISASTDTSSRISVVNAAWRLPRTPRERMNTIQPLVIEKYMRVAANVAQRRIKYLLQSQDIPVAQVICNYSLPENYLDDKSFEVSVSAAPEHSHSAIRAIGVAMSSISSGTVQPDELKDALLEYFEDRISQENTLSNSNYVERCVSSFLYNESLASDVDERHFLITRELPVERESAIFNSIASVSFKPDKNLNIHCVTPDGRMTSYDVYGIFNDAWSEKVDFPYESVTPLLASASEKIKIKSVKKEYLTDGSIWTLSNGLRVIVKKTDDKDLVNWAFISCRGYGNVKEIEQGEAAYFSEYPKFSRTRGVTAEAFHNALRRDGMTMNVNVGHSATCFSGRVPDDGLEYLLRALLIQLNTVEPDQKAFEYAKKCEDLRLSSIGGSMEARITEIDSVLCPDYKYSKCKWGMSDRFLVKGASLYEKITGCADSGVLVLIGDVDERSLKKALISYAGGFRTFGRRPSRPVYNYQPLSGTVELFRKGEENSVDIVLSAPILLTGESYYAAEIMALCLKRALSQIVTGRGMHVRVKHSCNLHPHERVSVMLSLREAPVEGFAIGTSHHEPMEALAEVRDLLRSLETIELTDAELASYKELLKQNIKRRQPDSAFWYDILSLRYIEGKDYYSSYETKIDAITREDIMDMLKHLSKGSRVEYVIER